MPLPVIADTVRVAQQGHLSNGHTFAVVQHFRKTPIMTYSAAIAALDPLILALWSTGFGGGTWLLGEMKALSGLDDFRYTPLDGTTATTTIAHALAAPGVSDALPAGSSLVVTEYTALRGRKHRGRCFLPAFTEAFNNASGLPDPTRVSSLQTTYNGWLASFAGSGLTPVVASYQAPVGAENIVSFLVRGKWSAQRRRNIP